MKSRVMGLAAVALLAACGERSALTEPDPASSAVAARMSTAANFTVSATSSVSISNASFEQGYTGWTYADVDIGALWQASDGSSSVDLNGFFPGWISQNISTIPGVVYTVLFDLAGNPGHPQGVKPLEVSAAATSATYSFNTTGKSVANMGWTTETFSFTATGTTTTLKFRSLYVGNGFHPDRAQGPALDNVRVTFVPPPTPTVTTVTFGPGPFVYTGSAFTATASVSPAAAGTATISYSGDCVNAGNTCTATATFAGSGGYAASSGSASIVIAKAPTVTTVTFGPGPFVYTGSAFTATASVSPAAAGTATISYSGDCINAGNTCTATATFAENSNFLSSSASTGIVIKLPVATSATQCKNGGWRFVTDDLENLFKNQGDCVSYVATKGRNKGAGS